MTEIHALVGALVIASNALAGVWGGAAWVRHRASRVFWILLRVAQVAVVIQVVVGFTLLASGRQLSQNLHLLYGTAPLLVTLVTEAMRAGAAQRELADVEDIDALRPDEQAVLARRILRREMGIMAVGALLIVTLALRAYLVGGGSL